MIVSLNNMATLADLKRALSIGTEVIMTYCSFEHRALNVPRYVVKTQSNGVQFAINKDDKRGSHFDYPKASLLDFDGTQFTIYMTGMRPLTDSEQRILDNAPSKRVENREAVERDIMTDGSSMYWADKKYFSDLDAQYLEGHETIRGLRYDWNEKKVQDETIRGQKLFTYTIKK